MTPRDSGARDGARTARAAGSGKSRAADERQPEGRASVIVRRRPERKADDMVRETARSARPERPEKAGAAERIETPETAGQDVRTGEAGQGPKAVIVRRGSPSRSRLDRGAKSGRARADEALPESQPADYAGVAAALRAADGVQVPAADGTGPGSMADAYEKAAGGADAADAALEAAEKEPDDEDGDASSDSEAILEDNPFGWGPGSELKGRVRFLRFYTWSTLPNRLVSLRDGRGNFLAPGYFACVQATRSAGPVVGALRQAARQAGMPLYMHLVFMPVVYPDVVPYRHWLHATNPFDNTFVPLHYLHKNVLEREMQKHLPEAIRPDRHFSLGGISTELMRKRELFGHFFSKPENAGIRALIWRDAVGKLFGPAFPQAARLVNYAVLRPEWIVDAIPLDNAPDLLAGYRTGPAVALKRLRRVLLLESSAFNRARQSLERRLRVMSAEMRRARALKEASSSPAPEPQPATALTAVPVPPVREAVPLPAAVSSKPGDGAEAKCYFMGSENSGRTYSSLATMAAQLAEVGGEAMTGVRASKAREKKPAPKPPKRGRPRKKVPSAD